MFRLHKYQQDDGVCVRVWNKASVYLRLKEKTKCFCRLHVSMPHILKECDVTDFLRAQTNEMGTGSKPPQKVCQFLVTTHHLNLNLNSKQSWALVTMWDNRSVHRKKFLERWLTESYHDFAEVVCFYRLTASMARRPELHAVWTTDRVKRLLRTVTVRTALQQIIAENTNTHFY